MSDERDDQETKAHEAVEVPPEELRPLEVPPEELRPEETRAVEIRTDEADPPPPPPPPSPGPSGHPGFGASQTESEAQGAAAAAAPNQESPLSVEPAGDAFAERPELYVGGAFVGGFLLAKILGRRGRG